MTEGDIIDIAPGLTASTNHPAWAPFVDAMAEYRYGRYAVVQAWAWFQDGFMRGRPTASSCELRCCACTAVIMVEATADPNGVVDCEGCGAHLAWFIPFAAALTGGVTRIAAVQIPEPGPSEEQIAALVTSAIQHHGEPMNRADVAEWVRNLPRGDES